MGQVAYLTFDPKTEMKKITIRLGRGGRTRKEERMRRGSAMVRQKMKWRCRMSECVGGRRAQVMNSLASHNSYSPFPEWSPAAAAAAAAPAAAAAAAAAGRGRIRGGEGGSGDETI